MVLQILYGTKMNIHYCIFFMLLVYRLLFCATLLCTTYTHPNFAPKMCTFSYAVILLAHSIASYSYLSTFDNVVDNERSMPKLLFLNSHSKVKRGSMWILLYMRGI